MIKTSNIFKYADSVRLSQEFLKQNEKRFQKWNFYRSNNTG